ncbi:hypothetical protein [Streptomyces sp. NPDC059816]|uniref:hypothetical protein n=1 Tax=Streptomyces sp. NPDC059816 TaxID=3346960 RepID=UPI0036635408
MEFRRAPQESGEWKTPLLQQRGWVLSAGFLFTMLVLAGVAAVTSGGDEDSSQPSPQASATAEKSEDDAPSGLGSGDGRAPECRTADRDTSLPKNSPRDLKWKNLGSMSVPVSELSGPKHFNGPIWSCYAHTPMGAVMAAHSITSRISYPGWRELAERQMVPGKARDKFLEARAKEKDKSLSAPPEDGRYAGFSVLSFTKERTSLMMLLEYAEGAYFTVSVNMQWQDGDWKLILRSDGSYSPDPSIVSDDTGFIAWGK